MIRVSIDIINKSGYVLPRYETALSAGCDLRAAIGEPFTLRPGERRLIGTGVYVALPDGYEAQVRGRSGLNCKHGLVVPVGTIDADYRGEIGVVIYNHSNEAYEIKPGDRIAQLVIAPVIQADWHEVETLDATGRAGGFGSTGKK